MSKSTNNSSGVSCPTNTTHGGVHGASGGINFGGSVTGQNQQFNQGSGNVQNNTTAKNIQNVTGNAYNTTFNMAMIEYENDLLNNPDLLRSAANIYGASKTINAVLQFDKEFIDEITSSQDADLLCAGVMSLEDDFMA